MDEMEEKLGSILSNPDAMQKIMSLAQSLNQGETPQKSEASGPPASPQKAQQAQEAMGPAASAAPPSQPPGIDLALLQRLSGLAGRSNIDKNQRTLLSALSPYLSRQRIAKLEKAMQAAKMAQLASSMLGGPQSNPGR